MKMPKVRWKSHEICPFFHFYDYDYLFYEIYNDFLFKFSVIIISVF